MSTQYSVSGSVAIIRLDNPPVNGLGLATRQGIVRDLDRALTDPAITSIVLSGNTKFFLPVRISRNSVPHRHLPTPHFEQ